MTIILLTLVLTLHLTAEGADPSAGKAVFASKCASCHSVGPSARGGFGPHLNAVHGRKAGGTIDYKYSPAMQESGIVWSEQSLTVFLQDPDAVVPGTRMRFWGMSNQQQIADLLAYLRLFQ